MPHLPESHFSEAARRRSRWGSVRGCPVLSSHFSPGLAPQVGHRVANTCFSVAVINRYCVLARIERWSIVIHIQRELRSSSLSKNITIHVRITTHLNGPINHPSAVQACRALFLHQQSKAF